jgi:DNA-binding Lrp family transcriptional regulator
MQAVVLVDCAPGFEESVEAQLRYTQGVKNLCWEKQGNYDIAVLVDVKDAAELQSLLTNRFRTLSGVKGVERVKEPSSALLGKLGWQR